MKLFFQAAILLSVLAVIFSGTVNPKKKCQCRRKGAMYLSGACLLPLPCKNSHVLPLLSDRKLGNKMLVYNQALYRAYPVAMRSGQKSCRVYGSVYNKKFNVCVKLMKCQNIMMGVPNGPVSKKYYLYNQKLYKSYPAYCN